jgi:7-cyano-7-deazaguanine synthase
MGSSVSADRSADVSLSLVNSLVLLSGGLDSAVLVAAEAERARVLPVYVRVGLAWEAAEQRMLRHLLSSPAFRDIEALEILDFDMRDVYPPTHWAVRGTPPAYDTPDEDVYLAGRNLVLLTKAGVVAASRKIQRVALGPLAGNPFPDATPEFFRTMEKALSLGLDHSVEVVTPLIALHKEDVIRLGVRLRVPFDLTWSCMNPDDSDVPLHCGQCSKCRERRDAFAAAGIADPTVYAQPSPR